MKKILGNNSGFTLVEVLVCSGILVISAFVLSDLLILNAKGQRNATSESQINALFDQIQKIAGAEWSCTASLKGSHYTDAVSVKDPVNTTAIIANEGEGAESYWKVTQIRMQNVTAVPGQSGVWRGNLALSATKNRALNLGSPSLSRTVNDIYFETNPDGTITRCYTASDTIAAAQSACQLLGGSWNANPSQGASNCQLVGSNQGG
jgi:prepilin-type N-terminal cleavage/methylation domain-containing protein